MPKSCSGGTCTGAWPETEASGSSDARPGSTGIAGAWPDPEEPVGKLLVAKKGASGSWPCAASEEDSVLNAVRFLVGACGGSSPAGFEGVGDTANTVQSQSPNGREALHRGQHSSDPTAEPHEATSSTSSSELSLSAGAGGGRTSELPSPCPLRRAAGLSSRSTGDDCGAYPRTMPCPGNTGAWPPGWPFVPLPLPLLV